MKIKFVQTNSEYEVKEDAYLAEMERAEPLFFKTKHGKRETFDIHRGFLIVRHTTDFGGKPTRVTKVYVFVHCEGKMRLLPLTFKPEPGSVKSAEKAIDSLIAKGEYTFGMEW